MDFNNFCLKCLHVKQTIDEVCPNCGFDRNEYDQKSNALPAPSILNGRYFVGIPLGIGGFGITYIAFDMKIGGVCAVKEYMPDTVAYRADETTPLSIGNTKSELFQYGLKRFLEEADMLKNFSNSHNIINVYDSFCENNTAYYVMEYLDGFDLRKATQDYKNVMEFDQALVYFKQIMNGLEELHNKGVIHRDISPDNVYITNTGKVKILDFGSARYSLTQKDRHLSVIVKVGYAPGEQYSTKAEQGPWTDIYALCATFYHLLSGTAPPESTERMMEDTLVPLHQRNNKVPQYFSDMITTGLSVKKENRYQSIDQMRNTLFSMEYEKRAPEDPVKLIEKAKHDENKKPHIEPRLPVGGNLFFRRICAYAIDSVLYIMIAFLSFLFVFYLFGTMGILNEFVFSLMPVILLAVLVIVILSSVALETGKSRGSIGKMVTGIKVVDVNGNVISRSASFKRNLFKLLGLFLLLTEKNNTFIHDRITNTQVAMGR